MGKSTDITADGVKSCPCGLDVKELMRELAMMQSCGRLMKFPYNGKVCKELLSGQSTPAKKF